MPPKRDARSKKGKKDEKPPPSTVEPPSEKEIILKDELERLTRDLEVTKTKIQEFRYENDWLQEEAQKVRAENQEYMSYMEKKTSKRQTTIVTLSDHNQKQIDDLVHEQEQMMVEFKEKQDGLQAILLKKEGILAKAQRELEDLQDLKVIREEQMSRIKDLEQQINKLRCNQTDELQKLKAEFLSQQKSFQQQSERKIADMSKQANTEALVCLTEHSQKVRVENRQLRHELLLLIRKTQALHAHKRHLEEQKQQLLTERQYAEDLKALRGDRLKQIERGPHDDSD